MTNEKLDDCCDMAVVHQVYPVPGTDAIDCTKSICRIDCTKSICRIDLPNRFAPCNKIDLGDRRLTD